MPKAGLDQLQHRLGYRFRQESLLTEALTHKSYLNEARGSGERDNERLEFLGDAVLNLVIAELLVAIYPEASEGELSKLRARLVSEETLVGVARRLGLGDTLLLGRGEKLTQGHDKPSILADALEAIVAGVYLEGGLEAASRCIQAVFREELASCEGSVIVQTDYKTELQEVCQREFGSLPRYRTIREMGPDHEKRFEVEVLIGRDRYGTGVGRSKKEAEQMAAKQALAQLGRGKEDVCDTGL